MKQHLDGNNNAGVCIALPVRFITPLAHAVSEPQGVSIQPTCNPTAARQRTHRAQPRFAAATVGEHPCKVLSVWLSNFEFCAALVRRSRDTRGLVSSAAE
jgi:hypothetical protein